MPAQPVLKNFHNIENRDAIIAYDREELVCGDDGRPVTRWDGRSMKTDLVTGREFPDETQRVALNRYVNPRPAQWPEADYIVGNPPFVGTKRVRDTLGDGYIEAVWQAYPKLPRNLDFVMYWWHRAAELVRRNEIQRFGLITTNSIRQTLNRKVVNKHLDGTPRMSLVFAIPDHPWYLEGDMASVRVAMTVGCRGLRQGQLQPVKDLRLKASRGGDELLLPTTGLIHGDLSIGANSDDAEALRANSGLCRQGVKISGRPRGAPLLILNTSIG